MEITKDPMVLWNYFGDLPMNPETEEMEAPFMQFPKGTHREEIWKWFESTYPGFSVEKALYGAYDEEGVKNTLIEYLYRDADNYKVWNEAVVSGVLTDEEKAQIEGSLSEGEYFLPQQVGLPEKRFDEETESDHPWFELITIKDTNAPTTGALTAKELLENFLKAKDCWEPND